MDDVQPIPIPEEPLPNRHVDEIRFSGEEILASQMIRSSLPQYKRKQQKRNKRKKQSIQAEWLLRNFLSMWQSF